MKYALITFSLLLFIFFPQISTCQEKQITAKTQSLAHVKIDPEFNPELGFYYYDIFWHNLRVGKASITIKKDNELYQVIVHGKTTSKINVFYKARYKGEVEMEHFPLKPTQGNISQKAGNKKKDVKLHYPQEDTVKAVSIESKGSSKATITENEFISDTFILDPFSAIFLVRHLQWQIGMAEVFDIFTGKEQLELKLFCHSVVELEVANQKRMAWLIIPETTSYRDTGNVTRSEFQIYLSNDSKKEVLKIEGTPRIGKVVANYKSFTPAKPQE